jgi:hypothetical protein
MRDPVRPRHRLVWQALDAMNPELLATTRCYFGGGTRIVLELDEYRESIDVDFLCSDRAGYRTIRSMITQSSFGDLFCAEVELMREIRADMYGIRTFLLIEGEPLKFEIVSEGRIDLRGTRAEPFPVPLLDHASCFAEKLLANADRGRDDSTRSRDMIDLAFMTASWPREALLRGLQTAVDAYGDAVHRELAAAVERLSDRAHRQRCLTDLSVSDPRKLGRGLRSLRNLCQRDAGI